VETLPVGAAKYVAIPITVAQFNADIFLCASCGHMMTNITLMDNYYDDFVMPRFVSTNYLIEERIRQIIDLRKYSDGGGFFLEIGCGDGGVLEIAKEHFSTVIGVEPSSASVEILRNKGLPYIHDYFSAKVMNSRKYDAFLSIQVFDHLPNPTEVLKEIYSVCNNNAVGLIEVPDGQIIQQQMKISYLVADHLNYFTPSSLAVMARSVGFQVIHISQTKFGNLEMLLRKVAIGKSFNNQFHIIKEQLDKINNRYLHISAWGAGVKMVFLLPMLEKIGIDYLFDNDPVKQGRYIYGCQTKIQKPDKDKIQSSDVILLFGTKYDVDIINDLKKTYQFSGDIITLDY